MTWREAKWGKGLGGLLEFAISQFLLLSFLLAAMVALIVPRPGQALGALTVWHMQLVQTVNIMIVFFISGLVLRTEDLRMALHHKLGVAYGFLAVLGITPCLGFAFREIPLHPTAFAAGLTVMCAVPTTLGVGIALVRSCKGNEGLALLLTVGTNMAGIATMPFFLKALLAGSSLSVAVDVLSVFSKLVATVLVPAVVGKAVREASKPVQRFTGTYKVSLGLFSTANLACIVWLVLSGARDELVQQRVVDILYVVLLAVAQHVIYLAFNFAVIWYVLRMSPLEAIATGIMSSQKSAPMAYTAISYITRDPSQQGLMAIPALVVQLSQVFIGSALVPYFSRQAQAWRREQETLALVWDGPSLTQSLLVMEGEGGDEVQSGESEGGEKGLEGPCSWPLAEEVEGAGERAA